MENTELKKQLAGILNEIDELKVSEREKSHKSARSVNSKMEE